MIDRIASLVLLILGTILGAVIFGVVFAGFVALLLFKTPVGISFLYYLGSFETTGIFSWATSTLLVVVAFWIGGFVGGFFSYRFFRRFQ